MVIRLETKGSLYAILATLTCIVLLQLILTFVSLFTNSSNAYPLLEIFQNYPFQATAVFLSLILSAYFFGRNAAVKLGKNINVGSSVGFVTALQVLAIAILAIDMCFIVSIIRSEGFTELIEGFNSVLILFLLLRISIPIILLGLPFALVMGYLFGIVLRNDILKNQLNQKH